MSGAPASGLEGHQKLVVHVVVGEDLALEIDLLTRVLGVPFLSHALIEFQVYLLKRPKRDVRLRLRED